MELILVLTVSHRLASSPAGDVPADPALFQTNSKKLKFQSSMTLLAKPNGVLTTTQMYMSVFGVESVAVSELATVTLVVLLFAVPTHLTVGISSE